MDAAAIGALLRERFDPDGVAELFTLSLAGTSTGLDAMTAMLQETTGGRTFADLAIPFVAMTVDLVSRAPAPIADGPVWDALLGATALAGMFPPHERDGQRLVDGLALVPVPTEAAYAAGADVVVSVNLMPRETLAAWPGEAPPPPEPERSRRARLLDTILEVMDVSQLEASNQHADLADVALHPRFGPGSWRDFHLADLFEAAGRDAARAQLPALAALARPAAP
jgi:NTE family protein